MNLSGVLNRSKKATPPPPSARDAQLRKRDEAQIAIWEKERDLLRLKMDAGYEGVDSVLIRTYNKQEVPCTVSGGVGEPATTVVKTIVVEGTERVSRAQIELDGLNKAIDDLRRQITDREAEAAADAARAELRRTDLPAEEVALRAEITSVVTELLPLFDRIEKLREEGDRIAAKYSKMIGTHRVGVPEIAKLVRGHLSLSDVFSIDSRFSLWLKHAKQFGLTLPSVKS